MINAPVPIESREAWLAARRKVITATDVREIVAGRGMAVFCSKTLPPEEVRESDEGGPMERGNGLEAYLLEKYARRNHVELLRPAPYWISYHPEHPWLAATLDAAIVGQSHILEAKTSNDGAHEYGDPAIEPDGVPLAVRVQCIIQMAVAGAEACSVLALVRSLDDFRVYPLRRESVFETASIERARRFRDDHILTGIAPPLDGSDAARRFLVDRFPFNTHGQLESCGPMHHAMNAVRELRAAQLAASYAETTLLAAEQRVCDRIGAGAGLYGQGFRITWKATRAGVRQLRVKFDSTFQGLSP